MPESAASSYDEVPYASNVFSYTRPERLATWAALLGMEPPPPDRCRVLELGCGTGGNLIPMAQDLPGSQFVGIDLSPRQIDMGREVVRALGLANIDLRPLSIADVGEDFGRFDYVLCHGVYSWVPPAIQDHILTVCSRNLAADGVAYVSYNTYPGWHVRGMIREMMNYHVRNVADPRERVQQARGLLDLLMQAVGGPDTVYGGLLRVEADMLAGTPDTYVYHEHLEEVNQPLYFHQFVERAAAKGLQFLAEAQPVPLVRNLSAEVVRALQEQAADLVSAEQYLDFVRNRTFRRTLLCHADVPLRRPIDPTRVTALHATGLVRPVSAEPDLRSAAVEAFETADGNRLSTNNPIIKTALAVLAAARPRAVPFEELWGAVRAHLARPPAADPALLERGRPMLADALLQCCLSGLVDLTVLPPRVAATPGERPAASPLARLQAGGDEPVTNLRHRKVTLDDFDRLVLRHLDGSRDRAALLDALAGAVADGTLSIEREGQPLRDPGEVRGLLRPAVEASLRRLADAALLVGEGA